LGGLGEAAAVLGDELDGLDLVLMGERPSRGHRDLLRGSLRSYRSAHHPWGSPVRSAANVETFPCRWQERPEPLRGCDIIFGCVDGFAERRELEIACRRHLVPLIDIGMDVHIVGDEPPRMGGQVILSMPGSPCLTCLGFLNEASLAREAARYGDAGPRPQVVWPNGVLASTAVGIAVDLLTNWTRSLRGAVYLMYDGNVGTITPHPRLVYHDGAPCPHFPPDQVGTPVFKKL
jgi:hypothetical protein